MTKNYLRFLVQRIEIGPMTATATPSTSSASRAQQSR
jgi:hypothetical protein